MTPYVRKSLPKDQWRSPFVSPRTLETALSEIDTPEGIQASSRESFKGAIFGRDSLEVGLDVVDHLPSMAERIVISVARLIGLERNEASEEEPGKGHHEYRAAIFAGQPVAEEQRERLRGLSAIWGGDENEMTYYGAMDTGALYLILLDRLCVRSGRAILDQEFIHRRTGKRMRISETVVMAAEFYRRRIEESSLGLVEFQRLNPDGNWYQVMRDGHDSMIFPDGRPVNPDAPIAAIEIQSVAHAALLAASRLVDDNGLIKKWRAAAEGLQAATLQQLWMPEARFFARSISVGKNGPELVATLDTSAGETLRDTLFDGLTDAERQHYVGGIARKLYSDAFLVDVGFRTQSSEYESLFDYARYQGPDTVWPTIVKRIADGFYRQGLPQLGADVDGRLIEGCERIKDFPEYFYVTTDGTPIYRRKEQSPNVICATHPPMSVQAWTASAAFGVYYRDANEQLAREQSAWQRELTEEIFEGLWAPFTASIDTVEATKRRNAYYQTHSLETPKVEEVVVATRS